eukprot:636003-Rhodomonas_salina.1
MRLPGGGKAGMINVQYHVAPNRRGKGVAARAAGRAEEISELERQERKEAGLRRDPKRAVVMNQ